MKLFRLRGGIHPDDHKQLSAECPIAPLPLPELLNIPLQQHIGAPANPVVKVGERVLKGQLLASGVGMVSAAVHAPTSGIIIALGDGPAAHPSGLPMTCITLEPDGQERWIDTDRPTDPFALSPEAIASRVAAAGVVGLGGATFPSAVKLNISRRSGDETLIINGGECEPYLTCDDRLMRERAPDVITGIRLMNQVVNARRILVGIESNKPQAISAMRSAAENTEVQIVVIPARYPMGSEKQLIQVLVGQEVPAGGRPSDIGVLVHNVGTAWAIQQAVVLGRPLVSRLVTVSGGAVKIPRTLEAPIGSPVQDLFAASGGFTEPPARMVLGGPMMGQHITQLTVPVVKGTSGVLAFTHEELGLPDPAPCIRCGRCVKACPIGLLPLEMVARIRTGDLQATLNFGLKDCIACGSCSYVCPAHIPLVHYFNHAKGELAARERTKLKQEATKKLAADRQRRMERVALEREAAAARRKAEKTARDAAKAATHAALEVA